MMRVFLSLCALLLLGACTPAIRDHNARLWEDMASYDYWQVKKVFGVGEAFPNNAEKEAEQQKYLCLHSDSEERVAKMNGVEDEVWYRRCVLEPYPRMLQPHRYGGRPDMPPAPPYTHTHTPYGEEYFSLSPEEMDVLGFYPEH